jgi:chromosome segregation ATPase
MADKNDILYDILKELKQEHKELREDVSEIKDILSNNTASLVEHMKRTATLEEMWRQHQERLIRLEEPKKVMSFLYNKWTTLVAIITGIIALLVSIKDLF